MKFFSILVCIFLWSGLMAETVPKLGEQEVKDSDKVNFRNKTTQKAAEETKALHESIGKKLAEMAKTNPDKVQTYQGVKVVRIPTSEKDKFAADILYLDEDTKFGHINSIQRIVSGYIQKAFDYNEANADVLATYVLYYNAMHRGKSNYFGTKYVSEIQKRISSRYVGIAVDYRNWPGKTEIVIPVEKNVLKDINRDVTLDELEDNVSKVIDDKKGGAEDKEKFEDLKREKEKIEKEKLIEKKEEVVRLDDLLEDKKKKLEDRLNELKKNPEENKSEIAKLEKESSKLDKEKAKLDEKKEDLKDKEEKITGVRPEDPPKKKETKEEVASKETKKEEIPKKEGETVAANNKKEEKPEEKKKEEPVKDVSKIEKELADKTRELEAKKEEERKKAEMSQNVVDGKILLIKPMTYIEGQCNNELHVLDPNKDDFVTKSEYNKICGKIFKDFAGNILVIGFKDSKDQIQLVLLSKRDLKPAGNSGETFVYHKTPLEIMDDYLYAIEHDDGKYYLSRFDKNLKRVLRTSEEVTPDATLTFYGKKIYLSGKTEGGAMEFKIFNKDDLKLIKTTKTRS